MNKIGIRALFIFVTLLICSAQATRPESSTCESQAQLGAYGLFRPSMAWLREHFRVGIERTYSSEILDGVYVNGPYKKPILGAPQVMAFRNLDKHVMARLHLRSVLVAAGGDLTEVQVDEVLRFLFEVLGVKELELHLGKGEHEKYEKTSFDFDLKFAPHFQPFTMITRTREGRVAVVTIEPACVEVNFNPSALDDLDSTWTAIEERAEARGFFNTVIEGGQGGGGTHMHLGWDSLEHNLWILRPDLAARMMFLPLKYRFLMYFWHELNDHGSEGNAVLPNEAGGEEFGAYQEYLFFLSQLALSSKDVAQRAEWIRQHSAPVLSEHTRAINLRSFTNEDNPRLQARFIRSLSNYREIKLLSETWIRIVYFLLTTDDLFEMSNRDLWYAKTYHWSPAKMRREMQDFLHKLGWNEAESAEIMQAGGQEVGHSQFVKLTILDPRFKDARYALLVNHAYPSQNFEMSMPVPEGYDEAWIVDDEQAKMAIIEDGWIQARMRCYPFHRISKLLIFRGENRPNVSTVLSCDQRQPDSYKITLGETAEHALARRNFHLEFSPSGQPLALLYQHRRGAAAQREVKKAVLADFGTRLRELDRKLRATPHDTYEFVAPLGDDGPEKFLDMRVNGQPIEFRVYQGLDYSIVQLQGLGKALGKTLLNKETNEFIISFTTEKMESFYPRFKVRMSPRRWTFKHLKPQEMLPNKLPAPEVSVEGFPPAVAAQDMTAAAELQRLLRKWQPISLPDDTRPTP